ncbi:MAG TPA: amidohydrolase family protein [Vicinamibacterales bacterium]|nr:amidohydrolase family protein [Vicinamibacterales bacterium]
MIRYQASWVLPVADPPIRDGWVVVDRGRVVALGHRRGPAEPAGVTREVDLGAAVVLPGLVNAHTHLELSWLRGAIAPRPTFVPWVRDVIRAQRGRIDPCAPAIVGAIEAAIEEARRSGTAAVGDISNTLASFAPLAASRLRAVVFKELIGFHPDDPDAVVREACEAIDALAATGRVRASLAAHAPYSVAPLLFRAIRQAVDRRPFVPCSVHLAESPEEVEFIATGGGAWRRLLEDVGSWNPGWVPPGVSPVAYLADAGFLDGRVLVVHGVQAGAADLARLAALGATIVTCPRSNRYTGAGDPPVAAFYAAGGRVAVGTDSLASAPDLNLFAELAALRALAPAVPAAALIDSATRQGARALGFDAELGTIAPGRAAALIAVRIPPGTADVEEYLVRGIDPDRVSWLDEVTEP